MNKWKERHDMKDNKKSVVIFLADGFEECEALVTVDLLRRAGTEVIMASIMNSCNVTGAHGIEILADALAKDVDYENYDMVVLPGGGEGTNNLMKSEIVAKQCIEFAANKLVAAICAAPGVLGKCGILNGKRATCYPSCEPTMIGATPIPQDVVVDENIITGRAPGAAIPFALVLISQLYDKETADKIRNDIVYK